jgi:hypothetical protein
MPRVQWSELVGPTSSLDLLVASLPVDAAADRMTSALTLQMLVRRLLKKLPLTGRYALTISRARGGREILCAFENAVDAEHAARAFNATSVEPRAGWTNQYTFLLDETAEERVLKVAGPGQPRRLRRAQPRE